MKMMTILLSLALPILIQAQELPAHYANAGLLVRNITPANNEYSLLNTITFYAPGVTPINKSVCSPFLTELLKYSYGLTANEIKSWTGSNSPYPAGWMSAIKDQKSIQHNGKTYRWQKLNDAKLLQKGDVIAIRYEAACSDGVAPKVTGHVMIVAQEPTFAFNDSLGEHYNVTVIDSSSSFHGSSDTRAIRKDANGQNDTGVGMGIFRLIVDGQGNVSYYRWSSSSTNTCNMAQRPTIIGRLLITP